MKTTSFIAAITYLATTTAASPLRERTDHSTRGLFGSGDNFVSNIFDSAACIVSGIIGGGNPKCHGEGEAVVRPPPDEGGEHENNKSTQYTYTYDTNDDGTLKVVITLERGGSCKYNLRADGNKVKKVIDDAAKRCLAEN